MLEDVFKKKMVGMFDSHERGAGYDRGKELCFLICIFLWSGKCIWIPGY